MRIVTICKQVPDSNAVIKVKSDGQGIETAGVKMVLNPFDEYGVEQAVQLREKGLPVEEIIVLTFGGEKAAEVLRTSLAMGADRGIHLCDEALVSPNEVFVAGALAAVIKNKCGEVDLVLMGKQVIDLDTGQLGPALAEHLGWPHVGVTVAVEPSEDGGSFKLRRRIEGAEEVMECSTPLLLTCEKGLVEPRYPSLPNLMKAKKKPVEKLTLADVGVEPPAESVTLISLAPPPPKPPCTMIDGEPEDMARELVKRLREEAKVI